MIVQVSGSREFRGHSPWPIAALNHLLFWAAAANEPLTVIHGFARGFDKYCYRWVELQRRAGQPVSEIGYPAEWGRYGAQAGPIRNDQMLHHHAHETDIALCMPHPAGSGTQDMIAKLRYRGIPIWELPWEADRLVPPPPARLVPAAFSAGADQ